MKICGFSKESQRIIYACKYGKWYFENTPYFNRFLSLQGDLTVAEYERQFAKLQHLCQLVERDGHDFIRFLKGLRPRYIGMPATTLQKQLEEKSALSTCFDRLACENRNLKKGNLNKQQKPMLWNPWQRISSLTLRSKNKKQSM